MGFFGTHCAGGRAEAGCGFVRIIGHRMNFRRCQQSQCQRRCADGHELMGEGGSSLRERGGYHFLKRQMGLAIATLIKPIIDSDNLAI